MPIPLIPLIVGAVGAGASAYSAWKNGKKGDKLQNEAIDQSRREYEDRQPFRDAAAQRIRRTINGDAVTRTFADPSNPFAANNRYVSQYNEGSTQPTERVAVPRGGIAPMDDVQMQRARLAATARMMRNRGEGAPI